MAEFNLDDNGPNFEFIGEEEDENIKKKEQKKIEFDFIDGTNCGIYVGTIKDKKEKEKEKCEEYPFKNNFKDELEDKKKGKMEKKIPQKSQGKNPGIRVQDLIFYILCLAVVIYYGTLLYSNMSCPQRYQHLSNTIIYPLNKLKHNTTSIPITFTSADSIPIYTLIHQLELHLKMEPKHIVLCSHHLQLPPRKQYQQLCVLYNDNRNEFIPIINPLVIGNSADQYSIRETTIRQTDPVVRKRYKTIILEWTLEDNSERVYSLFKGDHALMLQIVLDEF